MPADIADNHDGRTGAYQRFSALIKLKSVLSVGLDDHGLCDRYALEFAWRLENNSQAIAAAMRLRIVQNKLRLRPGIDQPMEWSCIREGDRHFESTIPELPGRRQLVRIRLEFA